MVARPLVLVVEDDRELRRLVADTLRATCDVVECQDGVGALDYLRGALSGRHPYPDLLVTDVRMPRLDGLAMIGVVRQRDPFLPVILVTAFADEKADALAEALGAMTTLRKPFDLDELARWVALCARPFVPATTPLAEPIPFGPARPRGA